MKIKRCPIVFHNVLGVTLTTPIDEWDAAVKDFRNRILLQGLYPTGPVIYNIHEVNEEAGEVKSSIYVPINEPVELDSTENYHFHEKFSFEDVLLIRHADIETNIEESISVLKECAEELDFNLDSNVYNIYLDVYGDIIIDVFIPIVGEKAND